MAIHNDLPVEITYYADHDFKSVTGKLYKIDTAANYIKVDNDERTKIDFNNITDVNIK